MLKLESPKFEGRGLLVKGLPTGANASEVIAAFGSFGTISKVFIRGNKAFVDYSDVASRENALKYNHTIRNNVLTVSRRAVQVHPEKPGTPLGNPTTESHEDTLKNNNTPQDKSSVMIRTERSDAPAVNPLKRTHDVLIKGPHHKVSTPPAKTQVRPEPKKPLDHELILKAFEIPAPISEQIQKLKELVLAGDQYCNYVQDEIIRDLIGALSFSFKHCDLYAFGSMTTGLAFKDSDVDVYAKLECKRDSLSSKKKIFATALKCFYRTQNHLFCNIVPIRWAKTPIIKILHIRTQTSCDLNFSDAIGFCNSRLVRHYMKMHERFFELIFFVKYWASVHNFTSTSKLSNFSLCMFGISFLMTLKDLHGKRILPTVLELMKTADTSAPLFSIDGWQCGFNESPVTVTLPNNPEFSLIGLLGSFFKYVASLPFETHVISVLADEPISRQVFQHNPSALPAVYQSYINHIAKHPCEMLLKDNHFSAMHDPFKLNHNLIGRVSELHMKEFILGCQKAAEECSKALECGEKQLSLFFTLLQKQASHQSSSVTKPRKSQKHFVKVKKPQGFNSLEEIKTVLSNIFRRILACKTTVSVPDAKNVEETQNKCMKLEDMQHVQSHNHLTDGDHIEFLCEADYNVWEARKKAKQHLTKQGFSFPSSNLSLIHEEQISDCMRSPNHLTDLKQFVCFVKVKENHLFVDFDDLESPPRAVFKVFFSFVKQHLQNWILHPSLQSFLAKETPTPTFWEDY